MKRRSAADSCGAICFWDKEISGYGTKNAGYAPGTEDSQNVHKINVFKKGLQFTKMDETFTNPLDGAEFELFTVDSSGAEHVVAGLTKNGAVFTIDTLEKLDAGEEYYIRETVSPPGYDTLQTPLKVTLTINDSYTIKHDGEAGETTTQKPADTEIYDWTETGDVTLSPDYTRLVDQEGNEIGHVVTDSTDGMSYYQIMNTPGVELPHAGGIGTTIFYVLGSILLLGCSVFMAARRRIMR